MFSALESVSVPPFTGVGGSKNIHNMSNELFSHLFSSQRDTFASFALYWRHDYKEMKVFQCLFKAAMNVSEVLMWWNIIRCECRLCINHIVPSQRQRLLLLYMHLQWRRYKQYNGTFFNNLTLSNLNYTPMSCSLQYPICRVCQKLLNSQFNMISTS